MTDEEAALIDKNSKSSIQFDGQEAILDMLILASIYEQNNLLADTLTTCERVIELAPEVMAFKTAYDQFVLETDWACNRYCILLSVTKKAATLAFITYPVLLRTLSELDRAIVSLSERVSYPVVDELMFWITNKYPWFPLYFLLIVAIVAKYRTRGLLMCLGMVLAVGSSDHITSGLMKPFFARLRPCQVPEWQTVVHLVTGCGGRYGFASSHASTTFALATTAWLMLRAWNPWFRAAFVWSALVAYSRVYVGVHYPFDIVVGAIVGVLVGWLVYQLYLWGTPRIFRANRDPPFQRFLSSAA